MFLRKQIFPGFSEIEICCTIMHTSASERRITVPSQRGTKSLSQTLTLTVPIWWNDLELNPSSWILTIFKKRIKTHLFIFIWPSNSSTLISILILFDLICLLFIKKKHKHLTLYQLHNYSLTASFSCKTNTKFNFSIFYILVFYKKKKKIILPT